MSEVRATIDIDAPVQDVWDAVMDPDRLGDWVTIHRAVNAVSHRPLRSGSRIEQTLRIHGVSFHVNWTLSDVTPPHRADWVGRGPAGSRASIRYRLSGEDGGPTTFEYTNDFWAPGGRLGVIASRVMIGDTSEREAHNSLDRLKALLEM
jgi:uncharacterized protein YndB with AHSA1/START domain